MGYTRRHREPARPSGSLGDLNLAMAAGIEIGHVMRTIAVTEPTLTAPARIIGMRTQSEVERTADRRPSRIR